MQKTFLLQIVPIGVVCFLLFGFASSPSLNRSEQPTADKVLLEVYKKLESLKTLQYSYQLELNYSSENYKNTVSGTSFIEFAATDPILGFKYQLENEGSKLIYNGTESFVLDKSQKTMSLNPNPAFKYFAGLTPFYNSMVTLRKALPAVLADKDIHKSLSDTSIAQQDVYLVKLVLNQRAIERLGGFSELGVDRKVTYAILVDKSSYLPVQIIQGNNVNNDFARTVFSQVTTNPASPSELSWYYSSYTDEFSLTQKKPLVPLALRAAAPDWQLPLFGSSESLKLSQLKGKVVLLEFWNKNCGYCISAVPKLNAITGKFRHKNFMVLGINLHDKKEDVDNFYSRNKPGYQTVLEGGKVAEAYGVGFYPVVVLLDKQGKVVYTGGIDEQVLGKHIQEALKQ
ncbi:hypothetical protein OB13_09390 [Pontibacter sp. HJ8]